jgi:hypothetical protein
MQEGIMKVRTSIAAAAAAVVLGTTGALALPAMASTHNASTTLKFTATTVKTVHFTRTNIGLQETDTNSLGKVIGFDDVNLKFTSTTSGTATVAVDLTGGFLYGALTTTNGSTYTGKVTGGTGTYKGATGTINVKAAGSKAAITIVYS